MTKLAILGAAGRMGQALIRCAQQLDSVRVGAAVEQARHASLGQDAGLVAGARQTGVLLTSHTDAAREADVLVDFSSHAAAPGNAALAASLGKGLVLGTTGLNEEESRAVREAAARAPIVWAPNMSLGMNVLFAMAERAAAALGLDYDVEIIESHHRHKQDAPSGTALRLAEKIAEGRGQKLESVLKHGRQGLTGERPRGQIGMHAVRAGDEVGEHSVLFATDGERIEFSHRATSRDALAMGALHAAVWVAGRKPGLYDMKAVLGL
jgi:4-hydroxy-tetrahydrodipicolinate reductase